MHKSNYYSVIFNSNKNVSYRKQIARQHSCHGQARRPWPFL